MNKYKNHMTQWFTPDENPVRPGSYLCAWVNPETADHKYGVFWSYYTGWKWLIGTSEKDKDGKFNPISPTQRRYWCGLDKPHEEIK